MKIVGISGYYHDSAAALVVDGVPIAAAQEERFTRVKHDAGFPTNAIRYCLAEGGTSIEELDAIAFYDKPFLKFERLLESYLTFTPKGFRSFSMAMPIWLKEKLFQKSLIVGEISSAFNVPKSTVRDKLLFSEHHVSHAASAYYPSPFESAAVLTMDGVGEWATTSLAHGQGASLKMLSEINFPHSLGLLYSAFTYYTGFKVNSGEYKLMGLAPYGEPIYADKILGNLINVHEDGSYQLDMSYFEYCTGLKMINKKFSQLFGRAERNEDQELEQFHMDIAASIQKVTEHVVIKVCQHLAKETGEKNLCLAGGVALNCVANGKLQKSGIFENIFVQPAAGDAGGALGCALEAYHSHFKNGRVVQCPDNMSGSYLGPKFGDAQIKLELETLGAKFELFETKEMVNLAAEHLANNKVVGWFQGRMEFGPRALGGRSIIGSPMSAEMQKTMNLKIKYRESFRPFAPSVLADKVGDWFDFDQPSPYMLMVANVKSDKLVAMTEDQEKLFGIERLNVPRSKIPAVTHVDYSARIQTVTSETNPLYYQLISKFEEQTGCPVVVNTSFNVRGEPIVCTPGDAFRCFMGTEMDVLVVGNYVLEKEKQNPALKMDYKNEFELD